MSFGRQPLPAGAVEEQHHFGRQPLPQTLTVNVTATASTQVADPLRQAVDEYESTLTRAPSSAAAGAASTVLAAPTSTIAPPPAPPGPAASTDAPAGVPSAPAAPGAPAGGVELDSTGLPWDGRIHASTRATIKGGTWRQKREVDPGLKKTVEAELRQTLALNAAAAPAGIAPPPSAVPGITPPPPTADTGFAGLLKEVVGPSIAAGKLTQEECDEVATKHGLANWSQLVLASNLIPLVRADLLAIVASRS